MDVLPAMDFLIVNKY